jgi:hypothetical protein
MASATSLTIGGYDAIANQLAVDSKTGFAQSTATLIVNKQTWDRLPLAAQQLLFDRTDAFVDTVARNTIKTNIAAAKSIKKNGGEFLQMDAAATDKLASVNEGILADVRKSDALDGETFVTSVTEDSDRWAAIVSDELKFPNPSFEELGDWTDADVDKLDFPAYTERVFKESLTDIRPGA